MSKKTKIKKKATPVLRAYVHCEYETTKNKSLKSAKFVVTCADEKIKKVFGSKDVVKNYKNMVDFIRNEIKPFIVLESSSMNHFFFDQNQYEVQEDGYLKKV